MMMVVKLFEPLQENFYSMENRTTQNEFQN